MFLTLAFTNVGLALCFWVLGFPFEIRRDLGMANNLNKILVRIGDVPVWRTEVASGYFPGTKRLYTISWLSHVL
jgi:hypothetical protein